MCGACYLVRNSRGHRTFPGQKMSDQKFIRQDTMTDHTVYESHYTIAHPCSAENQVSAIPTLAPSPNS